MKKYDYTHSKLGEKYQLVTEGAHLALRKEMFKEECWDHEADRPVMECWNEDGTIKAECWSNGPGMTSAQTGYGGNAETGELGEVAQPGANDLVTHLRGAMEAVEQMKATAHPDSAQLMEHFKTVLSELAEIAADLED